MSCRCEVLAEIVESQKSEPVIRNAPVMAIFLYLPVLATICPEAILVSASENTNGRRMMPEFVAEAP